ncbi:hypothetical protein D1AOALGA4SA_4395 [Olavius algarvensis Delta 1 endosymbiont]|nr:hypothetical protein D1AOALGA4SA_4395 [Olavius algarvensis Delta 1 endosymbiont]
MKQSIGAKALIVPTPVWVVGTYDHEGKPDVMTAAWGGICCSKPPCVAIGVQKIRYTYKSRLSGSGFSVENASN